MKRLFCIAAALLLLLMTALPVFAEPETTLEPIMPREGETIEAVPFDMDMPFDEEPTTDLTTQAPKTTSAPSIYQPPTAAPSEEPQGLFTNNQLGLIAVAALGVALIALLLAVVALSKAGGKKAANATGNYKKYF